MLCEHKNTGRDPSISIFGAYAAAFLRRVWRVDEDAVDACGSRRAPLSCRGAAILAERTVRPHGGSNDKSGSKGTACVKRAWTQLRNSVNGRPVLWVRLSACTRCHRRAYLHGGRMSESTQ